MSARIRIADLLVPAAGSDKAKPADSPAHGGETKAFGYQSLDLSTLSHQIRLLQFTSSSPLNISCTMQTVDLHPQPLYWALSYTWGPPEPTMEIMVNDEPMRIRENLYQFLSTWRNTTGCAIWIDQICINQKNDDEKNHQVNLMSQIFMKASNVVVWLGAAADDSDRIIAAFCKSRAEPTVEQAKQEQDGLLKIMERQYWHRVWIVQEILLASSLTVLCGVQEFPWTVLDYCMRLIDGGTTWSGRGITANTIFTARSRFQSPRLGPDGLRDILAAFFKSKLQCEDRRDKVFGLLGLIPSAARIEIRYDKTLQQICEDVVRKVVQEEEFPLRSLFIEFGKDLQKWCDLPDLDVERLVDYELSNKRRHCNQSAIAKNLFN
ncbi:hypothetical protein Vi05172_g1403 [Venturia inaequalis]|nr:hypothetical protein Vi05172_g1403 [Venturia inaequalis]